MSLKIIMKMLTFMQCFSSKFRCVPHSKYVLSQGPRGTTSPGLHGNLLAKSSAWQPQNSHLKTQTP